MYNVLKRVYAATSKRGVVPEYSALKISKGTVTATDGAVTRFAIVPDLNKIDAILPAAKFIKAVQNLSDNGRITQTDLNVIIKDGKFSARIPIMQETAFPEVKPNGEMVECDGLLDALSAVVPFVGTDASHLWSTGVMLKDDCAYATNNVTLVRYHLEMHSPEIIIPLKAVNELIKGGVEPMIMLVNDIAVTFVFDDESWLHTSRIDARWPDINRFFTTSNLQPIHPELFNAIKMVTPFCEDLPKIYFTDKGIHTGHDATGAGYTDIQLPEGCFHADVLNKILPSVAKVDWSFYPKPCPFENEDGRLEGVIMGLRV